MKIFTPFTGITPGNSRYRNTDHLFDQQRRKLYGGNTFENNDEFSIPHANISQINEKERGGYLLELAAPGYQREDFDISVDDNVLTVAGNQHESRVRTHDSFNRREHNYHTFSRSFSLPEGSDEDNITAAYNNGMLEVFVPVLRPVEKTRSPRRIEIGS